jgi:hypothetical protein
MHHAALSTVFRCTSVYFVSADVSIDSGENGRLEGSLEDRRTELWAHHPWPAANAFRLSGTEALADTANFFESFIADSFKVKLLESVRITGNTHPGTMERVKPENREIIMPSIEGFITFAESL